MEVYTLGSNFLLKNPIEEFDSVIWTERYSSAGDFKLSLPASADNVAMLTEGSLVGLAGSKEVMLVDTASIEGQTLTVSGGTLLGFLENRVYRFSQLLRMQTSKVTDTLGGVIAYVVSSSSILIPGGGVDFTAVSLGGVGGVKNAITNLTLGPVDTSGPVSDYPIGFGPVYTIIKDLAEGQNYGISLYLDSSDESGYSLKFTVYKGRDLTSGQSVYPLVQFSPALDSLTNTKELRSSVGYKNVAYAFSTNLNVGTLLSTPSGYAVVDDGDTAIDFKRRVLMLLVSDITEDNIGTGDDAEAILASLLNQKAVDGLANNNYTKMVDGEVVPQSEFKYGVHYKLGDVIELQARSELLQKARVTEFIRTQDSTGERAYPTVSVIE